MPDSRGSNVLVEYMRILLADHAKQEEIWYSGVTSEDKAGVEALLPDIHRHEEFKPELEEALAANAELTDRQQYSTDEVEAQVRRAVAQRAWEGANWEKAKIEALNGEQPFTPFDVAVSSLVRWIDVPGINDEQLREYLAGVPWGGPTERTKLVAELERLDREGYAYRLAESIKEKCPRGATRIGTHPEPPADDRQSTPGSLSGDRQPKGHRIMADDDPSLPLPSNRNQLEELRQWNAEMLETWRDRKDAYIRDYVMLGRWGENPQDERLRTWMLRLTYTPLSGQPDTRLCDPRVVFMLSAPVREYLPPNRLWHYIERLRHFREDAIRHNFDPRQLALDVQAAVYDLFSLPESLGDRLLIALQKLSSTELAADAERTPDRKTDKSRKLPRDDATRRTIEYVNRHRRKVAAGAAQHMSLHDLVAEFAGDKGASEVERIERALRPDRHGHHLEPDIAPDK